MKRHPKPHDWDVPLFDAPSAAVITLPRIPDEPIWTDNKARLIARYLYSFVLVTKSGAYIGRFRGPAAAGARRFVGRGARPRE